MSTTRPRTTPLRGVDPAHDPADAHQPTKLMRSAPVALMSAAGLLALMGTLLVTEDRTGVTLFPGALVALALAGIAVGCGLAGLTLRIRRRRVRGGRVALMASGLAAAGGILLVVMVPVGVATGGLSIGRPAAVDMLAAIAMAALVLGTFVAAISTGIAVWRTAIPSRAAGVALTLAGLLFLVPLSFVVASVDRPSEGMMIALFATWIVLFGGAGIALRRR